MCWTLPNLMAPPCGSRKVNMRYAVAEKPTDSPTNSLEETCLFIGLTKSTEKTAKIRELVTTQ